MNTLLWKDKKSSISNLLQELTVSGNYTDVAFVFDDGSQINSHKIVVAALSPVFKELLNSMGDDENQIIYLDEFKFDVFELLLEFMYFGEVTLERREQSIELHEIAKFFQVQFLKDENHSLPINENDEYFQPKEEENLKLEVNDIQETVLIDYTSTDLETSNLRAHIESIHEGVVYPCEKCEYIAKTKPNLNYHHKSKHNLSQFHCNQCD